MTRDQIVDEVRAARAALLQAAGGTLDGLLDLLTREEAAAGRTAVVLTPKRPDDHDVPGSASHRPDARNLSLTVPIVGRGTTGRCART